MNFQQARIAISDINVNDSTDQTNSRNELRDILSQVNLEKNENEEIIKNFITEVEKKNVELSESVNVADGLLSAMQADISSDRIYDLLSNRYGRNPMEPYNGGAGRMSISTNPTNGKGNNGYRKIW